MYQLGLLVISFSSSEKQHNMFFQGNALHSILMLPSISPPDTSFSVLQEVPDERPSEISENTWRYDNWVVDLDFSNAPGGNGIPDNAPRYWSQIGVPRPLRL